MSVNISVVICVFSQERWDDIRAAVASVRRQRHPAHEIIVSVDHNPDLHKRLSAEAGLSDVMVIENAGERGLSGGKNTGASVATGDVIAYLDDDAVADAGWLETFAARYEDPRVMGVGGRTLSMWPGSPSSRDLLDHPASVTALLSSSPLAECGTRPGWFPEEFDWTVGGTYRGMVAGPVRNVLGGNASFRREVFEIAGGFHTGIGRSVSASPLAKVARTRRDRPLGCEETEFCIRLRQRHPGTVLLYDNGAVIWHRVPEARARLKYFRQRCYAEGLSKALVARAVGAADGLSNERAHALKTLPRGVVRGLTETGHGGLGRAGAITLGLAWTTWGYTVGTVSGRFRK